MKHGRVWSLCVGVLAVAAGWTLLFRPFASLTTLMGLVVLGLLVMAAGRWTERESPRRPLTCWRRRRTS